MERVCVCVSVQVTASPVWVGGSVSACLLKGVCVLVRNRLVYVCI